MVNRTIFGTNCSDLCYFHLKQIKYQKIKDKKLGQIGHVGGVLKTSGPAVFKSVTGFNN